MIGIFFDIINNILCINITSLVEKTIEYLLLNVNFFLFYFFTMLWLIVDIIDYLVKVFTVYSLKSPFILQVSRCGYIIMRPSSLGGGRILRRTLSVRLSVCPSVPLSLASVTSRHLANYNGTHVLFRTRWGPHIVRPSRPHKFLFQWFWLTDSPYYLKFNVFVRWICLRFVNNCLFQSQQGFYQQT